uniref:Acyltransferase 3 domain-containing protein n=1 Tax=Timema genevievae TaxID=629358 RepID=A0A7R9PS15_TIMGE|nr:unnamed protein product [Timema genevievae]
MWNKVVKRNADFCKVSMWRNMLYVHNFYPIEEMCAPHTHQLAVDMQLSLVAPLLVYLLFVSQGWGILLLVTLQVIPIALRYNVNVQNNLSLLFYNGITLNQSYLTANMTYILPSHQATPYMFGIGLGYLLHKNNNKIHIPKVGNIIF